MAVTIDNVTRAVNVLADVTVVIVRGIERGTFTLFVTRTPPLALIDRAYHPAEVREEAWLTAPSLRHL